MGSQPTRYFTPFQSEPAEGRIDMGAKLGRTFAGRYSVGEKLGQGGMGAVYRGTDSVLGRDVALKLVTPNLVSDTDVIKRFQNPRAGDGSFSQPQAESDVLRRV